MKTYLKSSIVAIILVGVFFPNLASAKKTVFLSSPRYEIDIALTLTGKCDPYEGATFSKLSFSTEFDIIKFGAPQAEGFECWFYEPLEAIPGTFTPDIQIHGVGNILDFKICPAWDDDEPTEAKVVKGPIPFEPILDLLGESEIRDTVSMDNVSKLPIVPSAWFKFSTCFSILGDELAWQYEGIGGCGIQNYWLIFSVPVDDLAQGKAVMLEIPHNAESEQGTWSIIFTPLSED